MGSGVSVSHGRWGIKFRLRHSGVVVSWKGAAVLFDPRVRQSSTPECVCLLCLLPSSSPWGSGQLKGSCRFVRPQSASVLVFVCLRLCLPPSSSAYVFVHLRFCLPPLSSISVFVCRRCRLCIRWSTSEGLVATVVCALTVCAVFHAVRVKAFVVLWCLCCVVQPI